MGAAENRQKSSAYAAYMKERGIKRTTAACPNHCGAFPMIGGNGLLSHLSRCKGTKRKNGNRR